MVQGYILEILSNELTKILGKCRLLMQRLFFLSSVTMTSSQESILSTYETDDGPASKLIRKSKEAPFVPVGKSHLSVRSSAIKQPGESTELHKCAANEGR